MESIVKYVSTDYIKYFMSFKLQIESDSLDYK